MNAQLLIVLAIGLVLAADNPANDEAAKDLRALQGEWKLVSAESSGERIPEELISGEKWTFKDNKLIGGGRNAQTYELDPTQSPKAIDIDSANGPKGKTDLGIYALDGDTLRIAIWQGFKETRPRTFATARDEPSISFVFMRPAAADALFAARARKRSEAAEKDVAALQGAWKVVSAEGGGTKAPDEAIRRMKPWVFKEDRLLTEDAPAGATTTYTLDATKSPKRIDLTITRPGKKAKIAPAIYTLEGDSLRVHMTTDSTTRPGRFQTTDRFPSTMYVLKRQRP